IETINPLREAFGVRRPTTLSIHIPFASFASFARGPRSSSRATEKVRLSAKAPYLHYKWTDGALLQFPQPNVAEPHRAAVAAEGQRAFAGLMVIPRHNPMAGLPVDFLVQLHQHAVMKYGHARR